MGVCVCVCACAGVRHALAHAQIADTMLSRALTDGVTSLLNVVGVYLSRAVSTCCSGGVGGRSLGRSPSLPPAYFYVSVCVCVCECECFVC